MVKTVLSYLRANGDTGTIVFVRDMKGGPNDVTFWRASRKQNPDNIPDRLFERYASDRSPSRVVPKIPGVRNVLWVRDEDIKAVFGDPNHLPVVGWRKFHRRYRKACGVFFVGVPVLSEDGTKALIGFGLQRGIVGGHGGVLYLEKRSRNWTVLSLVNAYVS